MPPLPHVFFLYLLNSLFLGTEIIRIFLKFYGKSFVIQFELVHFRSLSWQQQTQMLLLAVFVNKLFLSFPQFGACKTKFMKLKCRSFDLYRSVLQVVS